MTITKAELEILRSRLAKPDLHLQFTPSGGLELQVHQTLDDEKRKYIIDGEKKLNDMQKKLRSGLEEARKNGFERGQFNALSHTHECNPRL